jgi:hypothetical protein
MLKGKKQILTFRRCRMGLYAAFDLHSRNSYLGIIDKNGKRIFKRKLKNDPATIREILRAFKTDIESSIPD